MKIEAVSVCVNYADFLRQVAPFNRVHFDRWVIVTSPDDEVSPLLIGQIGQIEWAVHQVGTDRQPAQELPHLSDALVETHPESRPD